jgi:hypothetical protein
LYTLVHKSSCSAVLRALDSELLKKVRSRVGFLLQISCSSRDVRRWFRLK